MNSEQKPLSNSVPNYELRFILSGHMQSVSSLKFSPDGSMLASAGVILSMVYLFFLLSSSGGKVRTS